MKRIGICIPVYNDWESATELIRRIDRATKEWSFACSIIVVDDGSSEEAPTQIKLENLALESVTILRLRRNLGHQRAIAVGLAYIHDELSCEAVLVMDGDGEDAPEDMDKLLNRFESLNGNKVVFAKRARRQEGWTFRLLLLIFKIVHRVLTGRRVEVGNFSIISSEHLSRLVGVSELWNHYAAAVFKARLPVDLVPVDRARRIAGGSRMDFTGLAAHGLSAMAVFADTVGVRLLMGTLVLGTLAMLGLVTVAAVGHSAVLAMPGWTSLVAGALIIVLSQALIMSFIFTFIALHGRHSLQFLPIRDYRYFVLDVEHVGLNG